MKAKRNLFLCLLLGFFLTACGGGGDSGGSAVSGGGGEGNTNEPGGSGGGSDNGNGGGGRGGKKLLVKMVNTKPEVLKIQYDDQNRVVESSSVQGDYEVLTKTEYKGTDVNPFLVKTISSMFSEEARYEYGTDKYSGVPTKYYQVYSTITAGERPLTIPEISRCYLNSDARPFICGDFSSGVFHPNIYYDYDSRGNMTKVRWTVSVGPIVESRAKYTFDDKKGVMSGMSSSLWTGLAYSEYRGVNNRLSANEVIVVNSPTTTEMGFSCTYSYTYDEDGYPTQRFKDGVLEETYEYISAH